MDPGGFDDAVQAFLRANVVPQPREPRRADALRGIDATRVGGPQGQVAAWRVGEGPAVLLVHGWEDDHSLWSPLIDALLAAGRAFVAFDLPAHGESEGEWGLGWQAADGIHAVAAALGPIDAVVAHSFATAGVLAAMSEGLAVERGVFVAPTAGRGGREDRWRRHAERLGVSHDVMEAARRIYEDAIGPVRASFDAGEVLATVKLDLLLVHSRDDERIPFAVSEELGSLAPAAELVPVDGLRHRATARDPDVVARIAEFVSRR